MTGLIKIQLCSLSVHLTANMGNSGHNVDISKPLTHMTSYTLPSALKHCVPGVVDARRLNCIVNGRKEERLSVLLLFDQAGVYEICSESLCEQTVAVS